MLPASNAQNPLPVNQRRFRDAGLLFVLQQVEAGCHLTPVSGVIDVEGSGEVVAGSSVRLTWPFPHAQSLRHRRLVVPVQRQEDGTYLALSAGLSERAALRLLAGLPDDEVAPSRRQVADAMREADAVGEYDWVVDGESSGLHVHARLCSVVKADPPAELTISAPTSLEAGGSWTFHDGADTGATFGYLFLKRQEDDTWSLASELMPWLVSQGAWERPTDT